MKKILLIGGGGHCRSVLDCLLQTKEYMDVGILGTREEIGKSVLGIPILGTDEDLYDLRQKGYRYAFVTVGSVGNPFLRVQLYQKAKEVGYQIPNIIDPSAMVSAYAHLEEGIFIGKGAIVNAGAHILHGAIINTGSIVEHDCRIDSFAHIAPGVVLSGGVHIGEQTHIGSNSTVKQMITIGAHSIIGMGSVVLKEISDHRVAYGNPCKEVIKL